MWEVNEKFIIQQNRIWTTPYHPISCSSWTEYRCHHTQTQQQILNENGKFISISESSIYMGVVKQTDDHIQSMLLLWQDEILAPFIVLELRLENSFSFHYTSFYFGQTENGHCTFKYN